MFHPKKKYFKPPNLDIEYQLSHLSQSIAFSKPPNILQNGPRIQL